MQDSSAPQPGRNKSPAGRVQTESKRGQKHIAEWTVSGSYFWQQPELYLNSSRLWVFANPASLTVIQNKSDSVFLLQVSLEPEHPPPASSQLGCLFSSHFHLWDQLEEQEKKNASFQTELTEC
ncbi:hypothetical protein XENOCAPTIV_015552 [Xenoophorus captivus]|uniref:Uncharacterized protein n=1 Tax=Xenoophorus captivus TaxID=1517983 RepID=A0ABV0QA71_9TELE